jgi:hypothetical protein
MNKRSFLILPLAAAALASCGNPSSSTLSSASVVSSKDVKWVTPVGAPALAFYDQGANTNWVSSDSPATVVVPALATDNYDAVVFDGISGLNIIAKNSYNYQLAQWISGGNFYLVSAKHTSLSEYAAGQTIDGFVKGGNADRAFAKLAKEKWGWTYADTDYHTENGVSIVGTNLIGNPASYDYFVIAEPVLTSAKAAIAKQTPAVTLTVLANLQTEWSKAYNQTTIPAAALFVNKTSYSQKKGAIDLFLKETQARQDEAAANSSKITTALTAYGDETTQKGRFGFTSTLVNALQKENKFSIFKTGDVTDKKAFANGFNSVFGAAAFADSLFL